MVTLLLKRASKESYFLLLIRAVTTMDEDHLLKKKRQTNFSREILSRGENPNLKKKLDMGTYLGAHFKLYLPFLASGIFLWEDNLSLAIWLNWWRLYASATLFNFVAPTYCFSLKLLLINDLWKKKRHHLGYSKLMLHSVQPFGMRIKIQDAAIYRFSKKKKNDFLLSYPVVNYLRYFDKFIHWYNFTIFCFSDKITLFSAKI